jgi:hypothetical protein
MHWVNGVITTSILVSAPIILLVLMIALQRKGVIPIGGMSPAGRDLLRGFGILLLLLAAYFMGKAAG